MRIHKFLPALVAAGFALATAVPAAAKPNAKPPKVKTAKATTAKPATAKPAAAHGPKTTTAKVKPGNGSVKAHGNSAQAKAVKPTQPSGKTKTKGHNATTASLDPADGQKIKGSKKTNTSTGVDTAPTTDVKLTKAQQKLRDNDNLRYKVESRLPPNIKPVTAAAGFKNLGQFMAAVNVSHNQGLDFFALKALMVGQGMSLGQAVQQLKGVDARTANRMADAAVTTANQDVATADVDSVKPKTKKRNDRS